MRSVLISVLLALSIFWYNPAVATLVGSGRQLHDGLRGAIAADPPCPCNANDPGCPCACNRCALKAKEIKEPSAQHIPWRYLLFLVAAICLCLFLWFLCRRKREETVVYRNVAVPQTVTRQVPVPQVSFREVPREVLVPQVVTREVVVPEVQTREIIKEVAVPQIVTKEVRVPEVVTKEVIREVPVPQFEPRTMDLSRAQVVTGVRPAEVVHTGEVRREVANSRVGYTDVIREVGMPQTRARTQALVTLFTYTYQEHLRKTFFIRLEEEKARMLSERRMTRSDVDWERQVFVEAADGSTVLPPFDLHIPECKFPLVVKILQEELSLQSSGRVSPRSPQGSGKLNLSSFWKT